MLRVVAPSRLTGAYATFDNGGTACGRVASKKSATATAGVLYQARGAGPACW